MADDSNGKSNGGLFGGLLGGLFSGLFGVVGQGMANSANRKINQSNNLFNAQQAQLQRDWQEEMYNRYSSPSALVQQYQEAGLNPALVGKQGQGAMFSGSSASASSPIAMQNPLSSLTQVARDMVELDELIKNGISHRAKEASEAKEADARAKSYEIENEFKPDLLKQDLEHGKLDLQNLSAGIKFVESQTQVNYDTLLNNSINRIFTAYQIENIGIKNIADRIQVGLDVLKTLADVRESGARVSEIEARTVEQQWINKMVEEHEINPRYAGQYWQTILKVLEDVEDVSSRAQDHYEHIKEHGTSKDESYLFGDFGKRHAKDLMPK